jgi:hypothetical protein
VESFVAGEGRCPDGEHELVELRYMKRARHDPWGQSLVYTCTLGSDGTALITVRSGGRDGILWNADDLVASPAAVNLWARRDSNPLPPASEAGTLSR